MLCLSVPDFLFCLFFAFSVRVAANFHLSIQSHSLSGLFQASKKQTGRISSLLYFLSDIQTFTAVTTVKNLPGYLVCLMSVLPSSETSQNFPLSENKVISFYSLNISFLRRTTTLLLFFSSLIFQIVQRNTFRTVLCKYIPSDVRIWFSCFKSSIKYGPQALSSDKSHCEEETPQLKENDHTRVFTSSDLNERHGTSRVVLSCLLLEQGKKEKGPCHSLHTLSTHNHWEKRGGVRIKSSWR